MGILCFFLFSTKNDIIKFLINFDFTSQYFIITYLTISSIYFFFPLPVTIIVLLNGFFFNKLGFIISMCQILVGSFFLKSLSNKINKCLKINLGLQKIDPRKFSNNIYSIFVSRLIFPYFLHNIYYGLIKVRLKIFIFSIFLAEIPITFALNQIGSSLSEINFNSSVTLISLINDKNFYIPFLIIIAFLIITNYLYKKNK